MVIPMILEDRDRGSEEALDADEVSRFSLIAEGVGNPPSSCSRRATDAVDVILGLVRKIVIEHVGDVLDVDASCGDVGRDEERHIPTTEGLEGPNARGLGFVAMDGLSGDASTIELLCQTVRTVLGPSEDDATIDHLRLDQLHEQATLVRLPDEGDVLVDAIGGGRLGAHVDANRIMEHRRDEISDALRHRCTEQEVLTSLRQEREDPPDVPDEAHVEHPIGLIEHQVGQIGQIEMTLLLQIEQASGCGDEDVDALPEGLDLGHVAHATEDDEASKRESMSVGPHSIADLGGQFTCR